MKKIYFIIMFLFVALFSFNASESSADTICFEAIPGTFLYSTCPIPPGPSDIDCTTLGGVNALCPVAPGWDCTAPTCPVTCDFGGPGCAGTNCVNEFEACGCSCGGIVTLPSGGGGGGGVPGIGCAAPAGDADGDGDNCDYDLGENMFNCPADCLPAGIPTKLIPDVIDSIISWLLTFAVGIAILILVYGGVCYVFSSGDTQKTENAKKVVKYALLGIFIVGISYAIIIVADMVFQ